MNLADLDELRAMEDRLKDYPLDTSYRNKEDWEISADFKAIMDLAVEEDIRNVIGEFRDDKKFRGFMSNIIFVVADPRNLILHMYEYGVISKEQWLFIKSEIPVYEEERELEAETAEKKMIDPYLKAGISVAQGETAKRVAIVLKEMKHTLTKDSYYRIRIKYLRAVKALNPTTGLYSTEATLMKSVVKDNMNICQGDLIKKLMSHPQWLFGYNKTRVFIEQGVKEKQLIKTLDTSTGKLEYSV